MTDATDAALQSSQSPQSLPTILTGTTSTPFHATQTTHLGVPRRIRLQYPPPLRHHASELLLSPRQRPLYIAPPRSAPLQFDPGFSNHAGFSGYNAYSATKARRRAYQTQSTDSPLSSLDCLASLRADGWSTEAMAYQGKINGLFPPAGMSNMVNGLNLASISVEDRRLGTPISGASSRSCRCSCKCGENGRDDGGKSGGQSKGGNEIIDPDSPEGLSWRRLHMSRAKLKATATTSELLSGFAMIAMVELQINEPTNVPEWLFVMFAVCTTILVAVHIFALMISTYLLPNIDAISKMSAIDVLRESPHERMRGFIELAWAFSTVLGLFLFLVEIAILCWVKFWDYSFAAATAATVIVIPVLIVFVAFAVHFYHSLVITKCEASTEDLKKLESMKRNLDTATITGNSPV